MDNAKNMDKKEIGRDDIITYGCSAHYVNLLASDFEKTSSVVSKHTVKVIKYFRDKHRPGSRYKASGATNYKFQSILDEIRIMIPLTHM